jgi:hypothetical protein
MACAVRAYDRQYRRKYLDRWEECWADTRIHGATKRQIAAMLAEERPAPLPLPLEPFRYFQFGKRTVHLDGCVEVEAACYGAPPGCPLGRIGRREDALFLGPVGTGKSRLAQAIGQAAIQQGYRLLYRETHILTEELSHQNRPDSNLAEDRSASATALCSAGGGDKIT